MTSLRSNESNRWHLSPESDWWFLSYREVIYLYQNGVEFRQKGIGAGLNLFWGHLHYFSGVYGPFPCCRKRTRVPPQRNALLCMYFSKSLFTQYKYWIERIFCCSQKSQKWHKNWLKNSRRIKILWGLNGGTPRVLSPRSISHAWLWVLSTHKFYNPRPIPSRGCRKQYSAPRQQPHLRQHLRQYIICIIYLVSILVCLYCLAFRFSIHRADSVLL